MQKTTQEIMAARANVTTRTIQNWEKEKPQLIRLLKHAIENDSNYLDFWNLFNGPKNFFFLHDFYLDFYFRFLNFYRKSVTHHATYITSSSSIITELITYLINSNRDELLDERFRHKNEMKLPLRLDMHIKPLIANCSDDLSEYILRNTIDDFETLVDDSYGTDKMFIEAIKISIHYITYKYELEKLDHEKTELYEDLIKKIGIDWEKKPEQINKKVILTNYIKVKDEFSMIYMDLFNQERYYKTNRFYIPVMIKRMGKKSEYLSSLQNK